MSTGNKPVKGRINKRKRVGKRLEKRGGKRIGAGQPKKPRSARKPAANKVVRKDTRAEFLDLLGEQSKKNGQHRLQVFADILHDKKWEKFRSTNAGGKVVSQLVDVIFNQPSSGNAPRIPGIPTSEDDEDEPEIGGPPNLPDLLPDPALKKKVA